MNASYRPVQLFRSRSVAAVVVLGVVLAGCGRGVESTPSSSVAPASTTTSVAAPTTVTTNAATATTVASPTTTDGAQDSPVLALAPDGLVMVDAGTGSTSFLTFGMSQDVVITALDSSLGSAGVVSPGNLECHNGQTAVAQWPEITVDFADGVFLSWFIHLDSPLTDMTGVGTGSSFADLAATWDVTRFESELGSEFYTGDGEEVSLHGVLSDISDTATVVTMWAGPICTFR